jgi:hypothetical protein
MKSLLHLSVSKTVLLLVSLGLFFGSLAMAEAGASHPLFVGAAHFGAPDHRPGSAEGYLLVYSATDPFEDGELVFNAHSSYSIYTTDGKLFKSVENHMSRSDEIPELVVLPVGSYTVEARSANEGYVRVQVVIRAGLRTIVDLDK